MEVVTNFFFSIVTNIGLKQTIKKYWIGTWFPTINHRLMITNVSLVQLTDDFK